MYIILPLLAHASDSQYYLIHELQLGTDLSDGYQTFCRSCLLCKFYVRSCCYAAILLSECQL